MRYQRAGVTGGTYFFTVNLAERKRTLLVDYIDTLRGAISKVKTSHPFRIDAMVVLPDHLHAMWTLPTDDRDYPTRWMLIKSAFSRRIADGERRSKSRQANGERGIWQRRYWEHLIRDERDYACHADYIHFNPVKHGYVDSVVDWPYSTFHREVERGTYPRHWAGGSDPIFEIGENRGE
jgi:putative transposase